MKKPKPFPLLCDECGKHLKLYNLSGALLCNGCVKKECRLDFNEATIPVPQSMNHIYKTHFYADGTPYPWRYECLICFPRASGIIRVKHYRGLAMHARRFGH